MSQQFSFSQHFDVLHYEKKTIYTPMSAICTSKQFWELGQKWKNELQAHFAIKTAPCGPIPILGH